MALDTAPPNEPRHEKTCFWHMGKIGADQLSGNHVTDQRLCFLYIESAIPLLSKSEISILKPSSVIVQSGLCQIWPKTLDRFFRIAAQIL